MSEALVERCREYLAGGGLFNPELTNHEVVRDLIIDLRDALSAQQKAEPVASDSYVQPVPDHCDRITWRGQYFHLPLATSPVDPEGIRLLREARQCVHKEANDEREIEGRGYYCDLSDRIDAYLAKVQHELRQVLSVGKTKT